MKLLFFLFFTLPISIVAMRPASVLKIPKINTIPQRNLTVKSSYGKIEFLDNIDKTIFPRFYLKTRFNQNGNFQYFENISHLENICQKIMDPDNLNQEQNVKFAKEIGKYQSLTQNFFSFSLYCASLWKQLGNKEIEKKYASLIRETLRYSQFSIQNDRIWDGNNMWPSRYSYPLNIAITKDLGTITELLLNQERTQVNLKDAYGFTPLHLTKNKIIAQLLIKKGADINAQDENGNTPLHVCPADLVSLLLENKADFYIKNNIPLTLFYYDRERMKSDEESQWIINKSKLDEPNLKQWYICEHGDSIQIGYAGLTPLMKSVDDKNIEKVNNLLIHASKTEKNFKKQIKSALIVAQGRQEHCTRLVHAYSKCDFTEKDYQRLEEEKKDDYEKYKELSVLLEKFMHEK